MKTKRSAFNLIELTLAIAVVGIGIASVMALFIPALNATRAAAADNYTPDVVNTFMSYLLTTIKQNNTVWTTNLSETVLSKGVIDGDPDLKNFEYKPVDAWTPVSNFSGLYQTGVNGVFGIKTGADFAGYLCVWQKVIDDFYNAVTSSNETVDKKNAIRYYFELSWPVGAPYENRERRLYAIEVFNSNAAP